MKKINLIWMLALALLILPMTSAVSLSDVILNATGGADATNASIGIDIDTTVDEVVITNTTVYLQNATWAATDFTIDITGNVTWAVPNSLINTTEMLVMSGTANSRVLTSGLTHGLNATLYFKAANGCYGIGSVTVGSTAATYTCTAAAGGDYIQTGVVAINDNSSTTTITIAYQTLTARSGLCTNMYDAFTKVPGQAGTIFLILGIILVIGVIGLLVFLVNTGFDLDSLPSINLGGLNLDMVRIVMISLLIIGVLTIGAYVTLNAMCAL